MSRKTTFELEKDVQFEDSNFKVMIGRCKGNRKLARYNFSVFCFFCFFLCSILIQARGFSF